MMNNDMDLVHEYARNKSEQAFATLVSRHVNLVYSVARRQLRDPHLAEEVTQTVFIILARKAGSLGPKTIVSGWLCRTTRYVSAKALTLGRHRQEREQEAYMRSQLNESGANVWKEIEPLLETGMGQLGETEHNALVLRFFEGRSFKEISLHVDTSEAAAKMRVNRALERLRTFFKKRGVAISTGAIAGAISSHSVHAAPLGLAGSITTAAIKETTLTHSTLTLIKTTLKLMAWTKLKTTIAATAVVLLIAGTTVTIERANASAKTSSSKFPGYATPEAAMQSIIWTSSKGDLEAMAQGVTEDQMQEFKSKMDGKSDEEIRRGIMSWSSAMAGYKITEKEVISPDEVHLHIHATPSAEALHSGKAVIVLKKIGNEWKFAGNAND